MKAFKSKKLIILTIVLLATTILSAISVSILGIVNRNRFKDKGPAPKVNAVSFEEILTDNNFSLSNDTNRNKIVTWIAQDGFKNIYDNNSDFYISTVTGWELFCYLTSFGGRIFQTSLDGNLGGSWNDAAEAERYFTYNFYGKTVYLDSDIDFSGIGCSNTTTSEYNLTTTSLLPVVVLKEDSTSEYTTKYIDPFKVVYCFDGRFDGQGYSLKNIDWTIHNQVNTLFFFNLSGDVENLCIENLKFKVDGSKGSGKTNLGVMTNEIKSGGEIRACMIDGIHVISDRYKTEFDLSYFAHINYGTLRDCVITGNVYNDGNDGNLVANQDGVYVYNFCETNKGSSSNWIFLSTFASSPGCKYTAEIKTNDQSTHTSYSGVSATNSTYWHNVGNFKYLKAFATLSTIYVYADGKTSTTHYYPSSIKHNHGLYSTIVTVALDTLVTAAETISAVKLPCYSTFSRWDISGSVYKAIYNYNEVTVIFKACAEAGVASDVSFTDKCSSLLQVSYTTYANGQIKAVTYTFGGGSVTYNTEGTRYYIDSAILTNEARHMHETNNPVEIAVSLRTYNTNFS